MIPSDPERLLSRKDTAAALTAAGFPIAATTLDKLASCGGGPAYIRFNGRALYRFGTAIEWARSRATPAATTASEIRAATQASTAA